MNRNTFFKTGIPVTPEALQLVQLVFTAKNYGNFSSQRWNPGLGGPGVRLLRRNLHSPDIAPKFKRPHMGMGIAISMSLPFPPFSPWLLHIFSYKTALS